jgi:hypothetical protein
VTHRVGTKLILRTRGDETPEDVADDIRSWVEQEMRSREVSDRDTEIVILIGMDPFGNAG